MSGIAVLLATAALGFLVSHVARIPAIPVVVVLGMAVSALVPLPAAFLEEALLLGVTVVLFVAGIELNPRRAGRYLRSAIRIGVIQFFVLGLVGAGLGLLFGLSPHTAVYLGLAVSASSTIVGVRILQQRHEVYTPTGRTVTGILLMQDLLIVLMIPIVAGLGDGLYEVAIGVGRTLGLVLVTWAVLRWVTPRVVPYVAENEEFLLLTVLAVLFLFVGLGTVMGVPLVSSAFLAGLTLSPFPVNALVRGQVTSLGQFFSAVFFTALGAFLSVPSADVLIQAIVVSGALIVLTPPIVAILAERNGLSARAGIEAGLLLSQASEFSLVVGLQGIFLQQFGDDVFALIALVTVITMMLTPVVATTRVAGALMRLHPFDAPDVPMEPPEGHVLILGGGSSGTRFLESLVGVPPELWIVDDDPVVADRIRQSGFPVVRGSATDLEVLRSAGAHRARLIISTLRHRQDSASVLAIAGDVPVLVRTFEEGDEEWVKSRGGIGVSYSAAAADGFATWFREDFLGESEEDPAPRSDA